MKVGLGTVQFGLDYGITNQAGKTPISEVEKILKLAAENQIEFIDTAALYGTSEESLGRTLQQNHNFKIVTKTLSLNKHVVEISDLELLYGTFQQSLKKLKQPNVYGLLVHNVGDLRAENGCSLFRKLVQIKSDGLVTKIGVSIYTAEEIDYILDHFPIDLIQLPLNVFDQRLIQSGHLKKLKQYGVEIHARSIFLQGLLLAEPITLPSYFSDIKQHLLSYHRYLEKNCTSALEAAIGFVTNLDEIDVAVIGVNDSQQLEEICAVNLQKKIDLSRFAIEEEKILNPSFWKS